MFQIIAVDVFGCAYDMVIITSSLTRAEALATATYYCGDIVYLRVVEA